jgi:hypothetical protein
MRYRLRTLLIVLALGPPVLAVSWYTYATYRAKQQLEKSAEVWVQLPGGGRLRIYPRDYGDSQFRVPVSPRSRGFILPNGAYEGKRDHRFSPDAD